MPREELATSARVFLSYAHGDRSVAERITDELASSGISTTNRSWETAAQEDLAARLGEVVQASDVVIVVLSPAASESDWVGAETAFALSRDLDQRGAVLIPVLAASTDVPPMLRDRSVVDLTQDFDAGLRRLVAQIGATAAADFSGMAPHAFEALVADLLRTLGFRLDDVRRGPDTGVDLRATYDRIDPFGRSEVEVWLVETKLYSQQRVSVSTIRMLAGVLSVTAGATHGLLVTNAQLTSVALEYVAMLERSSPVRLRVLDGVELRRLLREYPAVAERHFGGRTKQRMGDDDS